MGDIGTVKDVKANIERNIKDFGTIANIPDDKINEILGDPMVQSITKHSVTIDRCKAVCQDDLSEEELSRQWADCPKIIDIESLLTLADEPTYIYVYGLTKKQVENIEFIYNFNQSSQLKVDRIFE